MKQLVLAAVLSSGIALPVLAEDAVWSGEGSLSAGTTTGNTETTDLGLGIDLARETQVWKTSLEALADFGETEGVETKNRIFLAGQFDRQISERFYGFGRTSYEIDEFSGFDSRLFVGGGLGYDVLTGERATWSVEGGPGIKVDEVNAITTTDANGDPLILPATTEESFSVIGASNYAFQFNDNVGLSNNTDVLYAEESTQLLNTLALTAKLTQALSARISFDVRHDTNPPIGFENTDTASRISLVYALGG